jgi:hypothetical protein
MKQAKIRQVQHSAGIPIARALKSIGGKYRNVRRYLNGEEVSRLQDGFGYWINVTEPCVLSYGGRTWELKEGWNLIGWKV